MSGILYLLSAWLGETSSSDVFSNELKNTVKNIKHYIVENEKSARKFLKFIFAEVAQNELELYIFNKKSEIQDIQEVLTILKEGTSVGLLSEAGMPCIADPGNVIVAYCHQNNIKVHPITGPSSILLALISSGMNGQNFSFHGYLPIDKSELKRKLFELENLSSKNGSAQIFMETPFRNNALFSFLLETLKPNTNLCVATDLTLPTQFILTKTIKDWKKMKVDFNKKPTIFILENGI